MSSLGTELTSISSPLSQNDDAAGQAAGDGNASGSDSGSGQESAASDSTQAESKEQESTSGTDSAPASSPDSASAAVATEQLRLLGLNDSPSSASSVPAPNSPHADTPTSNAGDVTAETTATAETDAPDATDDSVSASNVSAVDPAAAAAAAPSSSLRAIPANSKILVNFRPTGAAPILKKTKFTLSATHRFGMVLEWLRKTLHIKAGESLFVFCNAAFSPNPDSSMYDLFQCFQVGGELVLNYALQDAWG